MSAAIDAGQLSVDALVAEGVTHIFGLGGGHIDPTWSAAPKASVKVVDVRHEAAAVYAAQGWALATGEPGVCLVTAGPGVTNAVTGLATALHDGAPVVCLAGAATNRGADLGEVEHLDQLEIVRPVTKWARRVEHIERVPETIARAFTAATSGRPGPVYVEIAIDLAHAHVDPDRVRARGPSQWREQRALGPPDELVARAADLLRGASRPAVVAGSGVWWSPDGAAALRDFVDATGMPVVTRQAGRGTVPDDHPLSMGRDWQQVVAQTDVLLVVGSRMNYFFGYGAFGHLDALIQVDIEPQELGRSLRVPDLAIVGDAGTFLRRLAGTLGRLDLDDWATRLATQHEAITAAKAALAASDSSPLHPMRVCAEVARRLPDGATVVPDGANNLQWCNVGFDARSGGAVTSMGSLGTIGHGVGLALGIACARPGAPVVWMVGDGSFGFHAMELDTAARHDLPIVTVIMNNRGWSAFWIPLGVRNYERITGMWEGVGELVESPEQLGPALDAAFASNGPAIVNVLVDPAAPWFPGRAFGP
ncbi:MAG TPA: thiamine pyrophosphate-binding protein [Acidimicrobiia bacterium]